MPPRRPLKGLVDFSDHFRRLPPWLVLGFVAAVSGFVAWLWGATWMGLLFGLFALGDGVMLAALPWSGRSYGPSQLPLLSLVTLRLALASITTLASPPWSLPLFGLVQTGLSLAATRACWVEPARLSVTRIALRSPRFNGCPPLRLLHISDLHIERLTIRERRLMHLVEELAPDVIVVTGDYLNISYTHDATTQRQTRELLRRLRARGGVYVITGSPSVDTPDVLSQLFEGLDVIWLRDRLVTLPWHGCRLYVIGVECSYDTEADEAKLRQLVDGRAADAFTLLLYHTPDVMPTAAACGIDLYLAGHTHGGQLRLPLFGALVTASIHGKKYEMGAYREDDTLLYVSRGVGLEGKGAPRARFLCSPEIALFTLTGVDG